jgi:DNA-directed RNA polymerase specialized sigma24 family protein
MAASGDEEVALQVAREVLAAGPGPMLVGRALVLAARRADAGPFARIAPADRDAVVLARLGGYKVDEIAGALAIERSEVKRRLTNGVRALALATTDGVLRTLPPRRGFGSAASPARGARAS